MSVDQLERLKESSTNAKEKYINEKPTWMQEEQSAMESRARLVLREDGASFRGVGAAKLRQRNIARTQVVEQLLSSRVASEQQ